MPEPRQWPRPAPAGGPWWNCWCTSITTGGNWLGQCGRHRISQRLVGGVPHLLQPVASRRAVPSAASDTQARDGPSQTLLARATPTAAGLATLRRCRAGFSGMTAKDQSGSAGAGSIDMGQQTGRAAIMDMRFEVAVIPVSDVDRAKEFHGKLGWRLDADFPLAARPGRRRGDGIRISGGAGERDAAGVGRARRAREVHRRGRP